MEAGLKIYQTKDFIKHTAHGAIDLESSLATVRQLAAAADFHRHHNILLDMRDTDVAADRSEAIRVAAEFAVLRHSFRNKIAVLIPDRAERIARAEFMKTCMDMKGFQWAFFTAYEDAIEWLSEVIEIPLDNT